MSIHVTSEGFLAKADLLLHDLWFDLPSMDQLRPQDGSVRLTMYDHERFLDSRAVTRFSVEIRAVTNVKIQGDPSECPDPVEFNFFNYKKQEGILVLESVHPIKILFAVSRLHIALDQDL